MPKSTVQSIVTKFKRTSTVEADLKTGRTRKMSDKLERNIPRILKKNPRVLYKVLIMTAKDCGCGVSVSARTISRSLKRNRLHSFRPRKTPLLTPMYLKAKLKYAKDHVDKEEKFTSSVIWSDRVKLSYLGWIKFNAYGGILVLVIASRGELG